MKTLLFVSLLICLFLVAPSAQAQVGWDFSGLVGDCSDICVTTLNVNILLLPACIAACVAYMVLQGDATVPQRIKENPFLYPPCPGGLKKEIVVVAGSQKNFSANYLKKTA